MKKIVSGISAITVLILAACNNSNTTQQETAGNGTDSGSHEKVDSSAIAEVNHNFTNVDPGLATSLKAVVEHYLHIKNALIDDDGSEAASGAKAMGQALDKIDKSLFTAEQKKAYDNIEEDLKEHAEHISSNSGKIEHQRSHFAMMSEDTYSLVKAFSGGKELYHDHCPMANDSKGAMWLSETKEVKNPYFAGKMNECVEVKEVIK
jgi:hypothetical protein